MWAMLKQHPIRAFAVLIVAVIVGFAIYMTVWMTEVLAGQSWCAKAIGADRITADSKIDIAASCVGLLTIQLKAIATNSHVFVGMFALAMLTIVVVVVAGAKVSAKTPWGELGVSPADVAQLIAGKAADATAAAAEKKAAEIKADAP